MDSIAGLIPPIILIAIIIFLIKRSRDTDVKKDSLPVDTSPAEAYAGKRSGSKYTMWSEKFRDRTRDEMAQFFSLLGIKTELSDRERPEESIGLSYGWIPGRNSFGIVDIKGGSIAFINVIREKRRNKHGPARYKYVFCVPDGSIPLEHKALAMKTIRQKSFPIFGKVLDVEWECASNVEPLVRVFSEDSEVEQFVSEFGDVTVRSHPNKFQGWTIESSKWNLTRHHWNTLQKIANYLISSPR